MVEATNTSKIDAATAQVKAEAAAKKAAPTVDAPAQKFVAKKAATKKSLAKKAPAKRAPAKKMAVKKASVKAAAKKTPAKTVTVKSAVKKAATKKTPVRTQAAKKPATVKVSGNPVLKLKDTIMATAEKTDITAQAKEMAADVQTRVKTAYTKAGEYTAEAGEFNKANLDAVVESGKILLAGAQNLVKSDIATGKGVVEIATADAKKIAGVKSPTDLFELQGEITRRNFDAAMSFGSQRTEALVKLYNDAFAPISNRVSVATERFSKAA